MKHLGYKEPVRICMKCHAITFPSETQQIQQQIQEQEQIINEQPKDDDSGDWQVL